jgi:hypothetical protein
VLANNTGLTVTTVGTGTENGISYIDYRFFGTAGGAGQVIGPNFEATTQVAAVNGQVWSFSNYVRLVGGSLANISAINLQIDEYTAGGTFVTAGTQTITSPTNAPLATQRSSFTRTLIGGGTVGAISCTTRCVMAAAAAVDVTLRFGLPQLELGAFVTSPIPTSAAVASRAVDVATMPVGPWFSAAQGTIVTDILWSVIPTVSSPRAAELNDGTAANIIASLYNLATSFQTAMIVASVAQTAALGSFTPVVGSVLRVGSTYTTTTHQISVGGGVIGSQANAGLPTITTLTIGNRPAGDRALNGCVRRIRGWPRVLSNAEFTAATL